jgi:hypothetical protein
VNCVPQRTVSGSLLLPKVAKQQRAAAFHRELGKRRGERATTTLRGKEPEAVGPEGGIVSTVARPASLRCLAMPVGISS